MIITGTVFRAGGALLAAATRGVAAVRSADTVRTSCLAENRPLTTLLPYDTDTGAVVLAAVGLSPQTYELSWARPDGGWRPFAVLRLASELGTDRDLSFDPVRHQVPGLRQYPGVRLLREPAYRRARRSSGRSEPDEAHAARP